MNPENICNTIRVSRSSSNWVTILEKYAAVCDKWLETATKIKEAVKESEADPDIAREVNAALINLLGRGNLYYLSTVLRRIEAQSLTDKWAEKYRDRLTRLGDKALEEMKPVFQQLPMATQEKIQNICEETRDFRLEKVQEVIELLNSQ